MKYWFYSFVFSMDGRYGFSNGFQKSKVFKPSSIVEFNKKNVMENSVIFFFSEISKSQFPK